MSTVRYEPNVDATFKTVQVKGKAKSSTVTEEWKDTSGNITFGVCTSVPSAASGYAIGCILRHATTGAQYINTGSATSCRFTGPSVGANANVIGSGVAISSSVTAATRAYADDGGVAIAATGSVPDYRVSLARMLFTVTQASTKIRSYGAMGQVKSYDAMWDDEQVAGVYGYMELYRSAATVSYGGYGKTAAVMGCVETTGTMTVAANHTIAGLAAISKLTSGLTQTGKTVGVLVDIYDVTNWSDATARAKWGYGLYVPARAANCGFLIGDFSSATAGSGVALNATYTAAARIYADDAGAALAAGEKRVAITRFLYATADTAATDQSMSAQVGQVKVAANLTIGGNLAGLCGYLEVAAGSTLIGGRYAQASIAAGVWGRVDVPSTAVAGTAAYVSAFAASGNLGGTHTGKLSVIHIPNPGAGVWDLFASFGATTGCTVANALVPATAPDGSTVGADLAIKIDLNGTAYYIPAYDTLHA